MSCFCAENLPYATILEKTCYKSFFFPRRKSDIYGSLSTPPPKTNVETRLNTLFDVPMNNIVLGGVGVGYC